MTKVGFIGLGIMGSRMASNLQKIGYDLVVFNRTKSKADALLEKGAVWGKSPAETASQIDILITMLATPESVREFALGTNGFLPALHPGALWIDSSTVNPSFTRSMAAEAKQRGIRFLDGPVAGTREPSEKAQLLFLVGGDAGDVQEAQPLFAAMGRKTIHAGPTGSGASLKMIFNLLLGQSMLAFAEALTLGQALGLSLDLLFESLTGTVVVSPFAISKRPKIEAGVYEPDFPMQWMQKDLQLASISAYETGVALPALNVIKEVYMLAMRAGMGEEDLSAVYRYLSETNHGQRGAD